MTEQFDIYERLYRAVYPKICLKNNANVWFIETGRELYLKIQRITDRIMKKYHWH